MLLIAETAILVVFVVAVLPRAGLSGGTFSPAALTDPGMLAILGFCFAAFMGFESTALYRAEARRPDRSIPRATYAAVAFLAIFYCLVGWSAVRAFGDGEVVAAASADPTGLFFAAMDRFVGAWASDIMYVLVLTSVLASQLAFHNAINRYAFSLSHDGLLPAALGRSHPRYLSPAVAGTAQSVFAAVVVGVFAVSGADPYLQLMLLVNTPGAIGVVALQALTSAAVLGYFLRRRGVDGARLAIASGAVATVLLAVVLYFIVDKVELLTGAPSTTNAMLVWLVPLVLAAGVAWALIIKVKDPSAYARIGGDEVRRLTAPARPVIVAEGMA
ncbi:APC family permease [Actinoplanes sp. CA-054009]